MRKVGLSFGLATAGMVFMASHVLAQTSSGGTGSTSGGSTTKGESSHASTTTTTDTSTTKSSALQGKVEKFDRSQNTLTLSGSDKTLHVDSSTTVTRKGSSATLEDIKEDDEVRASYSGSDDTVKVKSIDIITSASTDSLSGMGSGSSSMGGSTGTGTTSPPATNPPSPSSGSGEPSNGASK